MQYCFSIDSTRRPLYSILVLASMVAALVKLQEYGCFQLINKEEIPPPSAKSHRKPVFNTSTLMRYASIDMNKPKLKQRVDSLLSTQNRSLSLGMDPKLMTSKQEFDQAWSRFQILLSDWWRNKRFYPNAMSDLVKQISKGKYYKTCAVVGNSGVLLRTEYGELIDTHEVVVRLNNAKTNGYEPHVGVKTNISFINSHVLHSCATKDQSCFCHPYGENLTMIVHICEPEHLLDCLVCNSSYKSPLIVIDPQFDVMCTRIFKYYSLKRFFKETGKDIGDWQAFYSSGMQAVTLALGICEKVSLFGFGKSKLANHHYHTNQKAEYELHDYEAEYAFYHDLMERPDLIPFIPNSFKIPAVVMYH